MTDRPDDVHVVFLGPGIGPDRVEFLRCPDSCTEKFCDTRLAVMTEDLVGAYAPEGEYQLYLSTIDSHIVLGVKL